MFMRRGGERVQRPAGHSIYAFGAAPTMPQMRQSNDNSTWGKEARGAGANHIGEQGRTQGMHSLVVEYESLQLRGPVGSGT